MAVGNGSRNGRRPEAFPPPVDSPNEFVKRELDAEDDRIDVGVVIVGGGPAGLACANRLLQLLAEDEALSERLGEVPVAVVEKGKACGAHNLSGAVMRPSAAAGAVPGRARVGVARPHGEVGKEAVYWMLSAASRCRIPTPPPFRNHGNYVVSVAELSRWLAEKAEEAGAYILTETSATQLLVEDGVVRGVRSGDKGRGKDGEPLGNFEPGSDLLAKATVLAEGTWGHLTGAAIREFDLGADREPQVWALGVKEVWEVPKPLDRVIHTLGWPLRYRAKYTRVRRLVDLPDGRGQGLDRLRGRPRLHRRHAVGPRRPPAVQDPPAHARDPRGRQARRLGRQGDPRGRLLGHAQAHGARRGDLRRRRRHGQRARAQGHPLRHPLRDPRRASTIYRAAQGGLDRLPRLRRRSRTRSSARTCTSPQHEAAVLQGLLRRRGDHQRDGGDQGPLPRRALEDPPRTRTSRCSSAAAPRRYPKPDGKYTFDKLSSVYITGNETRDDAPNHIRVAEGGPARARGDVAVDVPGRGVRGARGRRRATDRWT